jgi:hypothetical protein
MAALALFILGGKDRVMPFSNVTDTGRWSLLASRPITKSFALRAELASLFIRPGDVVCDLGAGAQPLKSFLPRNTGYIPVDCVGTIPGTHIADFNCPDFTLPAAPFNVIAALGLFAYIADLEGFMTRLAIECEGKFIIFSYDFWKMTKRYRSKDQVHNAIEELEGGVAFFSKYVQELTTAAIMRRRVLFTGVLGQCTAQTLRRRSASEIILKHMRPAEYFFVKGLGRSIAPRWAA